jgi:hypothetical protein
MLSLRLCKLNGQTSCYLKSLSVQEIKQYRENGRAFFHSTKFKLFTKLTFAERLARLIEEDTGARL